MILYNDEHVKICTMYAFKGRCITSTLKTGDKEMTFMFRKNYRYAKQIKEEGYVRTKTDEFVIKKVEPADGWYTCTAQMNVEELEGKQFPTGFTSTEQTALSCVSAAIEGTGWRVVRCEVTKRRTIKQESNCSAWEIIQSVITTYRCEVTFDSIGKTISIYEKIGRDTGTYFMERLNLKKMQIQSDSYDFATRLIPVGKDGLMLNIDGKNYIENYQYSRKIKTATWKDDRYSVASSLLEDAEAKLDEMSKPYRSYTVEIKDLAASKSETYGEILGFDLGDTVMLISKSERIRERHRVVKMYKYPENPDANKCELANTRLSFEELQKQEQELQTAEISAAASSAATETLNDAVGNSEELQKMVSQIREAVEAAVDDTMRQLYATKAEAQSAKDAAVEESEQVLIDTLESYSTTTQVKEMLVEAITNEAISIAEMYATKKSLSDAQKAANEAINDLKDRITWIAEKTGYLNEYEDVFVNAGEAEQDGGEDE